MASFGIEFIYFFHDWIAVSSELNFIWFEFVFFFSYPNIQLSVYWNIWLSQLSFISYNSVSV